MNKRRESLDPEADTWKIPADSTSTKQYEYRERVREKAGQAGRQGAEGKSELMCRNKVRNLTELSKCNQSYILSCF